MPILTFIPTILLLAAVVVLIFCALNVLGWRILGRPPLTEEMRRRGLKWARTTDGRWVEVCDFCGANCGQCGLTERIGNFCDGGGIAYENIVRHIARN